MRSPARALVFRPGALGDTLLAVPALMGLRRAFPGLEIELVGHAEAGQLLQLAGIVDRVTSFDSVEVSGLFLPQPRLPDRWRETDVVVLWMAAAERLAAAFAGAEAGVVAADPRPPEGERVHVADYLCATLAPLGVTCPSLAPRLALPLDREQLQHAAVVHPGSGSAAKNWPAAGFADLLLRLAARGLVPVLLAGPADRAEVRRVQALFARGAPAVVRPANSLELAGALSAAALYVGNDSGVSHLAALLGVPSVVIFGATEPERWAPRGPSVRIVGRRGAWPTVQEVEAACLGFLAVSPNGSGG